MPITDYPAQPGRHGYVVLKTEDPGAYTVVRECPICRGDARVQVPAQGLWDWEHGTFVQIAFPGLSPAQRETLIAGTHESCWDALMGGDEE